MQDEIYKRLMAIESINNLSNDEILDEIGLLIDQSEDLGRAEGTDQAYAWCDTLATRNPSELQKATLEYYRANLWSARGHIKERKWHEKQNKRQPDTASALEVPTIEDSNPWAWEQSERQNQILCLRRCVNSPGFKDFGRIRKCQVYTNLANQLNVVGRPVDAIEYWDRALAEHERFGMALGNKGHGLITYARAMYDQGHRAIVLKIAYDLLSESLSDNAFYESDSYEPAKNSFKSKIHSIRQLARPEFLEKQLQLPESLLGSSETEVSYRQWCLNNNLFLNPLNDITTQSLAGRDVLVLPSYVTPKQTPPTYLGFFNEMKQAFATARWLLYEGTHPQGPHFSDNGVDLYDTLDYPSYSLTVEKVKMVFRVTYSLFDKIGYFLKDYMQLDIESHQVSFRRVWFEKGNPKSKKILAKFLQLENWPFRGLFWLSKDLHDETFADEMEPDARALSEIRNQLEHKYLKVHEILATKHETEPSNPYDWIGHAWEDQLAYSITRQDFENKALRLMKLARAALIYLCLGMRREEQRRYEGKNPNKIFPVNLQLYTNDQKR
jgi:HEPN superfamily protein